MLLSLIMFSLIDVCHTNSHLSWKSSWNIQPSKADVSITFVIVEHNFLSWQSVTFLTISLSTKNFPRATYMDLISFTFMLLSLIMFSLIDVCHTNSHLSWKSSWNIQPSKADVSITFVIVEHNFLSWQSVTFLTISLATKSFPRATYMDLISFTFMLLSLIMFSLIDVCHTNSHLSWKSSWNIQPSKADVSITFNSGTQFSELAIHNLSHHFTGNKKLSESYLHGFNLFYFYASFLDYVLSDRCVSHK